LLIFPFDLDNAANGVTIATPGIKKIHPPGVPAPERMDSKGRIETLFGLRWYVNNSVVRWLNDMGFIKVSTNFGCYFLVVIL
jgi:hypothetical protein